MELSNDRALVAIQGPKAVEILNETINGVKNLTFMTGDWFDYNGQKLFVTRSGYTGEDGFEVSIINDLAEEFTKSLIKKGAELIGLGARDTLRLEAGLCLYGHDLDENTSPIEANLKWAISKNRINDEFPGSELSLIHISEPTKPPFDNLSFDIAHLRFASTGVLFRSNS